MKVGPAAATIIERRGRQLEVHLLAGGQPTVTAVETGVGLVTARAIGADELQAHARVALRWLKAIGYGGLFRFRDMTAVRNQLVPCIMRRVSGKVDDLAEDLPGFDRAAL